MDIYEINPEVFGKFHFVKYTEFLFTYNTYFYKKKGYNKVETATIFPITPTNCDIETTTYEFRDFKELYRKFARTKSRMTFLCKYSK